MSVNKKKIAARFPLEKDHLSGVSVDCVVLGYHNKELKVLCSKFMGVEALALQGGPVRKNESLEEAAHRILAERTGVEGLFLKQFQTFGNKGRSLANTNLWPGAFAIWGAEARKLSWIFTNRFVSVCYYALTEFSKVAPRPGPYDASCTWVDVHRLPPFILDHKQMIREALKTLRRQIHHEPIGLNLLPEKFTLPELQALYETILGKKLDQRNFTKKLMSLDIVKKLDEKKNIGGHRSPNLYKFNKRAYNSALKNEIELAF